MEDPQFGGANLGTCEEDAIEYEFEDEEVEDRGLGINGVVILLQYTDSVLLY